MCGKIELKAVDYPSLGALQRAVNLAIVNYRKHGYSVAKIWHGKRQAFTLLFSKPSNGLTVIGTKINISI